MRDASFNTTTQRPNTARLGAAAQYFMSIAPDNLAATESPSVVLQIGIVAQHCESAEKMHPGSALDVNGLTSFPLPTRPVPAADSNERQPRSSPTVHVLVVA